jgi:hypothetical protein
LLCFFCVSLARFYSCELLRNFRRARIAAALCLFGTFFRDGVIVRNGRWPGLVARRPEPTVLQLIWRLAHNSVQLREAKRAAVEAALINNEFQLVDEVAMRLHGILPR